MISSMFSLPPPQVMEKLKEEVLIWGIFRISYFGVVFDLAFQTSPVRTNFQRCGNFDVTVLS